VTGFAEILTHLVKIALAAIRLNLKRLSLMAPIRSALMKFQGAERLGWLF